MGRQAAIFWAPDSDSPWHIALYQGGECQERLETQTHAEAIVVADHYVNYKLRRVG